MWNRRFAIFVLLAVGVTACSYTVGPHPPHNVQAPLAKRIPPADPTKYRSIQDAREWRNPYLLVTTGGIKFAGPAGFSSDLSPSQALAHLEHLPPAAWPYGLVVAVQENGVRASLADEVPVKANLAELLRLLGQAGIKPELWPSA